VQFGNPTALWALLIVPAAMLAGVRGEAHRRRRALERLGPVRSSTAFTPNPSRRGG
jgi:hypothetical protein